MGDVATTASARASQSIVMLRFGQGAAATGVVASAFFLLHPGVDLVVASWFYVGEGRFAGSQGMLVLFLRNVLLAVYVGALCTAGAGLALTALRARPWLRLGFAHWMFVGVCLCIGPGVVANLIFKDNWGRARPRETTEFAGPKQFTPALLPARECRRNCSFVSGEASSIFAMFFAAAALSRRRPMVLIGAGVAFGGLAGLLRMAQGAHFLSDVVFAGVFMALTVVALFLVFERTALTEVPRDDAG